MKPSLTAGNKEYMIYAPFGKLALFEDPDETPVYRGKAFCDVWQQKQVNWPGKVKAKTIWRWYFTRANWQEKSEDQAVYKAELPLRSDVSVSRKIILQNHASQLLWNHGSRGKNYPFHISREKKARSRVTKIPFTTLQNA